MLANWPYNSFKIHLKFSFIVLISWHSKTFSQGNRDRFFTLQFFTCIERY